MSLKNSFLGILLLPVSLLTLYQLLPVLLTSVVPQPSIQYLKITNGIILYLDISSIILIGIIGFIIAVLFISMKLLDQESAESIFYFHFIIIALLTTLFVIASIFVNSNLILGLFFTIVLYRSGLDAAKTFDFSSVKNQYSKVTGQSKSNRPPWLLNIINGIFGFLVMVSNLVNLNIPAIPDFLQFQLPNFPFPRAFFTQIFSIDFSVYLPISITTGTLLVIISALYVWLKVSFYGSESPFKENFSLSRFLSMFFLYMILVFLNIFFYLFILIHVELNQYLTIVALVLWSVGYIVQLAGSMLSESDY